LKTLLSKYADAFRYFKDSFLFMVILYILSLLIGIIIFKDSSYSINPQSVSFLYVFKNNIILALVLIIVGNLSFGIGSSFIVIFNGVFLGNVLISVFNKYGVNPLITGILPHVFPEMIALLMAGSISLETQKFIYNIRHVEIRYIKLRYSLYFFILLTCLLILAALIESRLNIKL